MAILTHIVPHSAAALRHGVHSAAEFGQAELSSSVHSAAELDSDAIPPPGRHTLPRAAIRHRPSFADERQHTDSKCDVFIANDDRIGESSAVVKVWNSECAGCDVGEECVHRGGVNVGNAVKKETGTGCEFASMFLYHRLCVARMF